MLSIFSIPSKAIRCILYFENAIGTCKKEGILANQGPVVSIVLRKNGQLRAFAKIRQSYRARLRGDNEMLAMQLFWQTNFASQDIDAVCVVGILSIESCASLGIVSDVNIASTTWCLADFCAVV